MAKTPEQSFLDDLAEVVDPPPLADSAKFWASVEARLKVYLDARLKPIRDEIDGAILMIPEKLRVKAAAQGEDRPDLIDEDADRLVSLVVSIAKLEKECVDRGRTSVELFDEVKKLQGEARK